MVALATRGLLARRHAPRPGLDRPLWLSCLRSVSTSQRADNASTPLYESNLSSSLLCDLHPRPHVRLGRLFPPSVLSIKPRASAHRLLAPVFSCYLPSAR